MSLAAVSNCRSKSLAEDLGFDDGLGGTPLFGFCSSNTTKGEPDVEVRGLADGVALSLPAWPGGVAIEKVSGIAPRCDVDGDLELG